MNVMRQIGQLTLVLVLEKLPQASFVLGETSTIAASAMCWGVRVIS
jgi:hypothetical protein